MPEKDLNDVTDAQIRVLEQWVKVTTPQPITFDGSAVEFPEPHAFGDRVRFDGVYHGIVTLIVVIIVMLIAEEAIVRLYRRLGGD